MYCQRSSISNGKTTELQISKKSKRVVCLKAAPVLDLLRIEYTIYHERHKSKSTRRRRCHRNTYVMSKLLYAGVRTHTNIQTDRQICRNDTVQEKLSIPSIQLSISYQSDKNAIAMPVCKQRRRETDSQGTNWLTSHGKYMPSV